MINTKYKFQIWPRRVAGGFTLVELVVASSAGLMVIFAVGTLLVSGHKSWAHAYNYANAKPQLGALGSTITFGTFGRKSNKMDYAVYKAAGDSFVKAVPIAEPEEVVTGEAVEFHYWNDDLNADYMKTTVKGTRYALFYLDENKLMLDTGFYPPGGIDTAGHRIDGDNVDTVTLAENVISLEFSHTTRDMQGDGKGCVRMNMILGGSDSNMPTTVTAATLLRNTWP
jgi:hypothetical protein